MLSCCFRAQPDAAASASVQPAEEKMAAAAAAGGARPVVYVVFYSMYGHIAKMAEVTLRAHRCSLRLHSSVARLFARSVGLCIAPHVCAVCVLSTSRRARRPPARR